MNAFTDLFIRRPVLASVVSLLILLIGGMAGFRLQVRQFPATSNTTITITTTYPGAAADVIKGFITTPIEQAVASSEGIDTLVSASQQNVSTITLNLRLDANPDRAMADTLSKVNQVRGLLPRDANDPVVVKQTGQGFALMYLSFNSNVMTSSQITDYLTRVVQPLLQTVDGVANAQILGGQTFAMRIWLDPTRMAALGVTANDVRAALAANNFTTAAGEVKSDFTQISVNALTSLDSAKAFGKLVIAAHGDALVRLGDVAKIELGPQGSDTSSVFDGLKAVFIGIYGTPEANPLTVIDGVRAIMPSIRGQLPAGLNATIAYDSTTFIRASIYEVAKTLIEAAAIVIVVIFLFLGNLRSTFIPIVTIPLSLIGVMIALMALGYSINLLTLLALVLAIGLVVDDAIVVVENIHRHIEEGMTPFDAAIRGAHEIALPIIAMTITLAAVYAPIGFVSGVTGALFREFAFTLAGAVIVSGFIALTLSPMMCSRLLAREKSEGWLARLIDRSFLSLRRAYKRRLHSSLNFRALTLLILVGVLALTGVMYASTPRELAPEEDQGVLLSLIKAPQVGNLDYTEQATQRVNTEVREVPEVSHVFTINGFPNVRAAFAGFLLKPWDERAKSQKQVLGELSPKFLAVPQAQVQAFSPPALPGSTGGAPMQFVIRTTGDYATLADVALKMQQAARESGLFLFTDVDLKFDTPQYVFKVDADKANRIGVNMADVGTALATMLGGNYVNLFSLYGRSYQVIPQAPREFRLTPEWLTRYQLRTSNGELAPLSAVASVSEQVQPNALTSFQQLNSATLSGVPFPGRTLGEALDYLKAKSKEIFPEGYTYDFQGEFAPVRAGGQRARLRVRVRADRHLSGAGRPVRELSRSVDYSHRAADGAVRRASAAQHRRVLRLRQHQHLFPDRPGHADRPHLQARHPDGRFRQPPAGDARLHAPRSDRGSGGGQASPDPDDDRGDGRRHGSAHPRLRRRRAIALHHRAHHLRRHGDRHAVHPLRHARGLHVPRPRPRGADGERKGAGAFGAGGAAGGGVSARHRRYRRPAFDRTGRS